MEEAARPGYHPAEEVPKAWDHGSKYYRKYRAATYFQVVHFMSAQSFDEGQAVFCIIGVAFALDWRVFRGFPMNDFAMSALSWVILPALCLLPGTLPFLRKPAQD